MKRVRLDDEGVDETNSRRVSMLEVHFGTLQIIHHANR